MEFVKIYVPDVFLKYVIEFNNKYKIAGHLTYIHGRLF